MRNKNNDRLYPAKIRMDDDMQKALDAHDVEAVRRCLSVAPDGIAIANVSLLHHAVYLESIELVEGLLKMNVPMNEVDHNGETAIYISARRGYVDIFKALLYAGADHSIRNLNGVSLRDIVNERLHYKCMGMEDHDGDVHREIIALLDDFEREPDIKEPAC